MRFVDLVVDVAAVLNASRSVASRHIALRSRQLGVSGRSTGVPASWTHAKQRVAQSPIGEVGSRSARAVRETEQEVVGAKSAAAPVTSDDQPEARRPEISRQEQPVSPIAFAASTKSADKVVGVEGELGVPPGIDVGIFHTARGSKLLESSRRDDGFPVNRPRPAGPAKEHPLRHWPNQPPVDVGLNETSEKVVEESDNAVTPTSATASPSPAPASSRPESSTSATALSHEPASSRSDAASSGEDAPKVNAETINIAKELMGSEASSPAPYKLRESKVPSSRFGRLWNYGGLAAGMLGGAVTESVSRAFGGGGEGSLMLSGKNMERLVSRLSRMRGAALKLGQMMSLQDSKMLPASIQQVLQRVQDKADYMPAWQRDRVLVSNLGENWRDLFAEFEETPIAAASIGQVHKAVLKSNGKKVAVKIQFPGVAASIDSDLDNLGILLNATKLLPKGLYLNKTIDNARTELGWECDYEREAQCAKRYKELLESEDVFLAPDVHLEASGKQVLTMDFMEGIGVTRIQSFTQEQRDWIGTHIMRLCLREIAEFKFMQTDPNWTNFLYNAENNKLELLDFGASREYPEQFVRQYVQLLEAASRADRQGVKVLSEHLGYLTGHESKAMVDAHVDSVLTLAEPFGVAAPAVYDFKDQTITDRVRALIPVMLHERLSPPPEETYSLHRKLSGAFLLCARLGSRVPCRDMFVKALDKSGYIERK